MSAGATLNYGNLMQKAMRRMMADVLAQVAENGLPGEHHFYISFETGHPGVDIPDWLRETYPDEMTIVLQEWYDELAVTSDRFSVTLNFSDSPQKLVIPLEAVRTFVDPSVKFGLKFEEHEGRDSETFEVEEYEEPETPGEDAPASSADVVSLDKFRKH